MGLDPSLPPLMVVHARIAITLKQHNTLTQALQQRNTLKQFQCAHSNKCTLEEQFQCANKYTLEEHNTLYAETGVD